MRFRVWLHIHGVWKDMSAAAVGRRAAERLEKMLWADYPGCRTLVLQADNTPLPKG